MALITLPPRQTTPASDDISTCCTPDQMTMQSMFAYGLALLLNKVGGADYTDCDAVVTQFQQEHDLDVNHAAQMELDLLIDTLAANGITVTAAQLMAGGACIRNSLPLGALQAMQFILWNLIVNELTP